MDLHADIPTIAAALAASLIAVDGKLEKSEMAVATSLGVKMFPSFAPMTFETLLDGISQLPPAYELACVFRELVDEEGKKKVLDYLAAIATADDMLASVERDELEAVAKALGAELPELSAKS
ncbi:MAG: TerB family tellurite resistance protein [Candidatus Eremiobacteraeota bacterium]|nr:TerB family tellurite resistance protein [Candidatus Eremiobacteraeota bacterium]